MKKILLAAVMLAVTTPTFASVTCNLMAYEGHPELIDSSTEIRLISWNSSTSRVQAEFGYYKKIGGETKIYPEVIAGTLQSIRENDLNLSFKMPSTATLLIRLTRVIESDEIKSSGSFRVLAAFAVLTSGTATPELYSSNNERVFPCTVSSVD